MNREDVTSILIKLKPAMDNVDDPNIKDIFQLLLSLIENLVTANDKLREEKQKLSDAYNLLKGEQGKPEIKKTQNLTNFSLEEDRKLHSPKKDKRNRTSKKSKLQNLKVITK